MTQASSNLVIIKDLLICIVLILGFTIGYIVYSKFKVRVGGVIATPLLTIYIAEYPISAIVFLIATVLSYIMVIIAVTLRLIYGRRLFYISCITSIATTLPAKLFWAPQIIPYVSVIPGIIAYHAFQESESVKRFIRSLVVWLSSEFIPLLLLAYLFLRVIST